MSKQRSIVQKIVRVIGITLGVVVVLALVVPFLVPLREDPDLVSARELASPDSTFATVPFAGTDGIEIHYVDRAAVRGRGVGVGTDPRPGTAAAADPARTFVLLHGSMFTLSTWDDVATGLAELGRVIAYDQVPYGLSEKIQPGDWSGENPYSQSAAVEQLIAFLDELGLERVTLVGHSYGGTLATRAAIEYPQRIEALVLVAPAVYVSESMPGWLLRTPQVRRLGPLMARSLATSESFFEMCYADPEMWAPEKAAATTLHTRVAGWDTALWSYLQAWNSADTTWVAQLPAVSVPTLVVAGTEDAIVPTDDSRRAAEEIPGAVYREFPGAGHMVHEEAPERTLETIAGWLEEL
jgi:pimeloyl-ACP methyl ester carboxylesterase